MLRVVGALPDPDVGTVEVLGVDDFSIKRGRKYATVLIDAVTHRRVDVLPNRRSATLAAWLREHSGVRIVCRDGSAAYAEAIRQGAPRAVQVSDRWHLWHGLASAVEKTEIAHSGCWNVTPRRPARHWPRGPASARRRPRTARPGHRPAGVLPPVGLVAEHRQTLRTGRHRRAVAASAALWSLPGRRLS